MLCVGLVMLAATSLLFVLVFCAVDMYRTRNAKDHADAPGETCHADETEIVRGGGRPPVDMGNSAHRVHFVADAV